MRGEGMEEFIFESGEIDQEVVDAVDDKLLKHITSKTLDLIKKLEKKTLNGGNEVFDKFDKFMFLLQNTIELAYACVNAPENTMPIAVTRIAVSLSDLTYAIKNHDHMRKKDPDKHGYVLESMHNLIKVLSLGYCFESENHFSLKDIEAYKLEMEKQESERKQVELKLKEEQIARINKTDEIINDWLKTNAIKDFDFSILKESAYEALKVAIKNECKTISISWIQRKLNVGYARAGMIIDHLEEKGAISTLEEALALGIGKARIIKVVCNKD